MPDRPGLCDGIDPLSGERCDVELTGRQRRFCSSTCKSNRFYHDHPDAAERHRRGETTRNGHKPLRGVAGSTRRRARRPRAARAGVEIYLSDEDAARVADGRLPVAVARKVAEAIRQKL